MSLFIDPVEEHEDARTEANRDAPPSRPYRPESIAYGLRRQAAWIYGAPSCRAATIVLAGELDELADDLGTGGWLAIDRRRRRIITRRHRPSHATGTRTDRVPSRPLPAECQRFRCADTP